MTGSRRPRDRGITGGGDRYETLLEVLEHQARQAEQDRELERRLARGRGRRVPAWVAVALMLVAGWLWLFPPSILRRDAPPPPPVAEEAASLRFSMYVQAQRIEAFRERTGALPEALEVAGPPLPGMKYERLAGDLYQLTGATDRVRLTYRSDLPLREFVGDGASVLEPSGSP